MAAIASELGSVELAFESILEASESGTNDAPSYAVWHPMYRAIRQLPAFKTYIHDIGLYYYWRESGKWPDLCRPAGDDDFVCE